ncbi:MAG TPA: hypothetical protein VNG33_07660 [Polyangiaceae bacterium]|nr:hypothetical protein [Polyangiaceae bacterium]
MFKTRYSLMIGAFLSVLGAGCSSSSKSDGSSQATATGCAAANKADYDPPIDPADFSSTIDNPLLHFAADDVFMFIQTEGGIVEQDTKGDTKLIDGVETLIVHDFLTSPEGVLLEDTYDYFAQDKDGAVWYFGEDTKEYSGKVVSTEGSWLAGEDCAKPGVVMPATPKVGDSYRQEYLPGEAEDMGEVVDLNASVTVPYGSFDGCLETKEYTALAPGDVENKYYCPGPGLVSSHDVGTIDAGKTEDLTSINGQTMP